MMDEILGYLFVGFLALLFLGLLVLAIYNTVKPKNKIQRGIDAFRNSKPILKFERFLKMCFFLFLFSALVYVYFAESDWYPRDREVPVWVNAFTWVNGEFKTCYSDKTPDKEELVELTCDLTAKESHVLRVKFWGMITPDKEKLWKCERKEASLTCKLQ